jgi:putative membrane protein
VAPIREPSLLLGLALAALAVSAIGPHDYPTWFLETAPVWIALPILVATRRTFPLTPLLYRLLLLHALVLIVGGHWTYAEVPAGDWVREALDLARNPYDRLGHLAQGFVPAILAREILSRRSPLRGSRWLPFLVVSVCLAFSAFYEMIEWWVALAVGEGADAFLGTQGDPWDTQWDMALCGIGAMLALALLSRRHDRELACYHPAP